MENNKLKEIIESKANEYFSNEKQKFAEWRNNKMITKEEHHNLIKSIDKNKKIFTALLNEILK